MAKVNARNNDFLNTAKTKASPQIYSMLVDLVNDGNKEFAELVLKIDYLLQYSSSCIKDKDWDEARESLDKAKNRIEKLEESNIDTEYLRYLYEGIESKCKK
ncbi:hypothetical protein [Clostridium folliculivorans]|uniref:Uncharacterized protein n=1 Tax=Clostridium folliculivorans TaxID=2886038 RepID=A0A9W5Y4X3_9CLOT|nr:hypothetical protein [Clostridium folliculivorans]GKU26713.1 hypothetical protein CFOLD11_35400 [Clostridium folliculivorans]GKU28855.1 hypothetical protein CFB3_09610 [Clostridium folliculivorans]